MQPKNDRKKYLMERRHPSENGVHMDDQVLVKLRELRLSRVVFEAMNDEAVRRGITFPELVESVLGEVFGQDVRQTDK